jgi:hypothetical protein
MGMEGGFDQRSGNPPPALVLLSSSKRVTFKTLVMVTHGRQYISDGMD